ncbi:MAG TPA: GyrI-like domain-containing protein [Bacteroidia bacterium]|nr:GyrI-like domain-containing protein [Bacteroidia bacterium]
MFLRFETLNQLRLAGMCKVMSFTQNTTHDLWRSFMPLRKTILNQKSENLYSLEIYPDADYFKSFDPERAFEKWAAVEVQDQHDLPEGISPLLVPAGEYAVFLHKGPASEGAKTYTWIFMEWLPSSGFEADHRPHFAVMDKRYKYEDPGSEEEIWIPIKSNKIV